MKPSRPLALGTALAAAVIALQAVPAHADTRDARKVGLPFLWPEKGLHDIEAAAPDDVWATGFQGRLYGRDPVGTGLKVISENPVARRWTGTGWKEYPIRGWTGHGHLTRAAARGGTAWIAGVQDSTRTRALYLARLTDGAFQPVPLPEGLYGDQVHITAQPGGTFVHGGLGGGTGAAHLWRHTGGGWTAYPEPGLHGAVGAVDAPAADDVWLAGNGLFGVRTPLVRHWDGTAWRQSAIPDGGLGTSRVSALVAPAADHAWAAGVDVSTTGGTDRAFLARWDGTAWTRVPFPDGVTSVARFTRAGDGTFWAVGRTATATRVEILRLDGTAWRPVDTVHLPAGTRAGELDLVPGTHRLWARGTAAGSTEPVILTDQ